MCETNSKHVHTEECTPEILAASQDALLARLNDPTQKLTEAQFRILRGRYFTIRHYTVPECGHKLDMINEPTFRNCEYCWFCFFSSHGELVQVTDEAFQEHGAGFVDRLRGVTYRKNFTRFMATLAAFKKEADAMKAAQEKTNEMVPEQRTGEVTEPTEEREGTDVASSGKTQTSLSS